MGLDSVELLMEWEKYFDIQIPDLVAEKINTVQNAVDAISTILNLTDEKADLKDNIFGRLQNAVSKTVATNPSISQSDLVYKVFPDNNKQTWTSISTELGLEIPFPPTKSDDNSLKTKVLTILNWTPKFNYAELTFSDLTDIICGNNSQSLINAKSIKTKYEIYIVLMAITVDKIGIDIYEFKPDKTFTGDFGID
jgi:acyl carrier protein